MRPILPLLAVMIALPMATYAQDSAKRPMAAPASLGSPARHATMRADVTIQVFAPFGPVAEAEVIDLADSTRVFTDSSGIVRRWFLSRDGAISIGIRKLGFKELAGSVPAGKSIFTADLIPIEKTYELPEVVTKALADKNVSATMREFYKLLKAGNGTFVTPEEMDKKNPLDRLDYLLEALVSNRGLTSLGARSPCVPPLYLDGAQLLRGIQKLPWETVGFYGAIAVYAGSNSMPPGYKPSGCGAVFLWSRDHST